MQTNTEDKSMSGEADSPGWHSRSAVTTHEELILTCGGLAVALSPVGGQRVGDWIGVLVKQMVAEMWGFASMGF